MRLLLIFLLLTARASAATWVSDGTQADIQSIHDTSASDGDTITIPAGAYTWNGTTLDITKAVTIEGAGIGVTFLDDAMPTTGGRSVESLMQLSPQPSETIHVKGFTVRSHASKPAGETDCHIYCTGGNSLTGGRFAIGNIHFDEMPDSRSMVRVGNAYGVLYSLDIDIIAGTTFAIEIDHGAAHADTVFSQAAKFGTDEFVYIEDCDISRTNMFEWIDTYGGARWVARYNTFTNTRFGSHGTDSTANKRGQRAVELYNNTLTGDGSQKAFVIFRSGSGVFYNETYTNIGGTTPFSVAYFRSRNNGFTPWGGADGNNAWDTNDTTDGAGTPGGAGDGVFESGTATAGSGQDSLVDSSKSWTVDEWAGYAVTNLNDLDEPGFSTIISNTSSTITVASVDSGYGGQEELVFDEGDNYEIRRVSNALDMPSLGEGDLIDSAGTPTPANQTIEGLYSWNNSVNGTSNYTTFFGAAPPMFEDTHYFNNTQKPGYSAYTYPHPLRGLGATRTPSAARRGGAAE